MQVQLLEKLSLGVLTGLKRREVLQLIEDLSSKCTAVSFSATDGSKSPCFPFHFDGVENPVLLLERVKQTLEQGHEVDKSDLEALLKLTQGLLERESAERIKQFKGRITKCVNQSAEEFLNRAEESNGNHKETLTNRQESIADFLLDDAVQARITDSLLNIIPDSKQDEEIVRIINKIFNAKTHLELGIALNDRLTYLERLSNLSKNGISIHEEFVSSPASQDCHNVLEKLSQMFPKLCMRDGAINENELKTANDLISFTFGFSETCRKPAEKNGDLLFGAHDYEKKTQIAELFKLEDKNNSIQTFFNNLLTLKKNGIKGYEKLLYNAYQTREHQDDISGYLVEAQLNCNLLRYGKEEGIKLKEVSVTGIPGKSSLIESDGGEVISDSHYTVSDDGKLVFNNHLYKLPVSGSEVIVLDSGELTDSNGEPIIMVRGRVREIDAIAELTNSPKNLYIEMKSSFHTAWKKELENGQIRSLVTIAKSHGAEPRVMTNYNVADLRANRERMREEIDLARSLLKRIAIECPLSKGYPSLRILDKFGNDITTLITTGKIT